MNRPLHTTHHRAMGLIESTTLWPLIQRQQQRKHQTTRTGNNRSTATHAPKHWDPISLARFEIDFQGDLGRSTYDNARLRHLPYAEKFAIGLIRRIHGLKDRLIESEVLLRCLEGVIPKVH
jgi:hypothetical protein